MYKVLRLIFVFEAIYWLGLLATGVVGVQGLFIGAKCHSKFDGVFGNSDCLVHFSL
jgi:hypothetical protein